MCRFTGIKSLISSGVANRAEHPEVSTLTEPRQPPRCPVELLRSAFPLLLIGVVLIPTTGGCAASRSAPTRDPYRIAVRYDVEPRFVGSNHEAALEAVGRDFGRIAELGFDTVVLLHAEDGDRLTLLNLAADAGLKASVPDRQIEHYTTTGALPDGCPGLPALIRALPRSLVRHPACHGITLVSPRGQAAADRIAKLQNRAQERTLNLILLGADPPDPVEAEVNPVGTGVILVDSGTGRIDPEASPLEPWLAQYHAALGAGRTGDLVLDRYRKPPGDPAGVVAATGRVGPAEAAAIDALTSRARHWGPRLHGLTAHPIPDARINGADLRITGFSRGQRRYVLVSNPATDSYAHGEVTLPDTIRGEQATRAVEVPVSGDLPAGRVVNARRGLITLDLSLRPGDAVLFETF